MKLQASHGDPTYCRSFQLAMTKLYKLKHKVFLLVLQLTRALQRENMHLPSYMTVHYTGRGGPSGGKPDGAPATGLAGHEDSTGLRPM